MQSDLTNSEAEALAQDFAGLIESARFPMSPRVQTRRTILSKLRPGPEREPPYHRGRLRRVNIEGADEGVHRSTDDPGRRRGRGSPIGGAERTPQLKGHYLGPCAAKGRLSSPSR